MKKTIKISLLSLVFVLALLTVPQKSGAESSGLLKEYLFPIEFEDVTKDDLIGLRIYENLENKSAREWYFDHVANPAEFIADVTVDGYRGIRDGRSVYVQAGNLAADNTDKWVLFTNIYVLAYNQNASKETAQIFDSIVYNFKFNKDIMQSFCLNAQAQATKDKVRRDTVRKSDLYYIGKALGINGSKLNLEAGTYVPQLSVSTWPSWQQTFSKQLGVDLPVDPLNVMAVTMKRCTKDSDCRCSANGYCSDCPLGYDANTCWDEKNKSYYGNIPGLYYAYDNREDRGVVSLSYEYQSISFRGIIDNQNNACGLGCVKDGNFYKQGVCISTLGQVCDAGEWRTVQCGDNILQCQEKCEGEQCLHCLSCYDHYNLVAGKCQPATRPVDKLTLDLSVSEEQVWTGTDWSEPYATNCKVNAQIIDNICICSINFHEETDEDGIHYCAESTRIYTCPLKPGVRTVWNSVAAYTQKWDKDLQDWLPAKDLITDYNVEAKDDQCRFKCALDDDTWNESKKDCEGLTPIQTYTCLTDTKPEHTVWNSVSFYVQSQQNDVWLPPASDTIFSNEPATEACHFICEPNYTWDNVSKCVADYQPFTCTGLINNAQWNKAAAYIQTWDGTSWQPPEASAEYNEKETQTACHYICKENYVWDSAEGRCNPEIKTFKCEASLLPDHAKWFEVSEYEQEYTGNGWYPPDSIPFYNDTIASADSCQFKCKDNYEWDQNTHQCNAKVKEFICDPKLEPGTQWFWVSSFWQTWDGSAFYPPAAETKFSTEEGNCHYKCAFNYSWDSTKCIAQERDWECPLEKPDYTEWNTVFKYHQKWAGSDWDPVDSITIHNDQQTTTACHYKCQDNLFWDGNSCEPKTQDAFCAAKPDNSDWNDGGNNGTFSQIWDPITNKWNPETRPIEFNNTESGECHFTCKLNFVWESSICKPAAGTASCGTLPLNADWNYTSDPGNYSRTWNPGTNDWDPSDPPKEFNDTVAGDCHFKCKEHYIWHGSSCDAEAHTLPCGTQPLNSNWNDDGIGGFFIQTWNGSAFYPQTPPLEYNETAGECHFLCLTDYHFALSQTCESNFKTGTCNTKPDNTNWNDGAKNGTFSQIWDSGSGFYKPQVKAAEFNFSEVGDCNFVCKSGYNWNGTACIAAPARTYYCGIPSSSENYEWNSAGSYTQTYNSITKKWEPSAAATFHDDTYVAASCHWKCKAGYVWDGYFCVQSPRPYNCGFSPDNTAWGLSNGTYLQNLVNGIWTPPATPTQFGDVAQNNEPNSCYYHCVNSTRWEGNICITSPRNFTCGSKPANTVWTDGTTTTTKLYSQNFDSGSWTPVATPTIYNVSDIDSNKCNYKCAPTYSYTSGNCIKTGTPPTSRIYTCGSLPDKAAFYASSSTYTQTYDSTSGTWLPREAVPTHGTNSGPCMFKCASNYSWNEISKNCIPSSVSYYCGSKPINTAWTANMSSAGTYYYMADWSGSSYLPMPQTTEYSKSSGGLTKICQYTCASNVWDGINCIPSISPVYSCGSKPPNSLWTYNGSFSPYWNITSYYPVPQAPVYNPDTTNSFYTCRFKCASGYVWKDDNCVSQ
ncbi:MAG: hypothetical protein NTZ49_05380 [Candidatus Parcubacteria bacterium]|nr:hypothetical protein [Candidatus Parcubacteria bacterium]